jgi:hypothetical protein
MTAHMYALLVCEILTEVGDRDYNQICYGRSVIEGWDCRVDRDSIICKDLSEWEYHWCITGMYNRLPSERHISSSPHYELLPLNYFTTLYLFIQQNIMSRACGADWGEEKCVQEFSGETARNGRNRLGGCELDWAGSVSATNFFVANNKLPSEKIRV